MKHGFPLLFLMLSACAVGRVSSHGDLHGIAFGHAKLSYCVPVPTVDCSIFQPVGDPVPSPTPTVTEVCRTIEGGALSTGLIGFLDNIITAVMAYFTAGAVGL